MLELLLPAGFLEGNPASWYAVVRPGDLRVPPYDGTPRPAAAGEEVRILVIEEGGESDVFVSMYAASLGYLTDTWHETRERAAADCANQFGIESSAWLPVPVTESTPESYVLPAVAHTYG